MHRPVHPAPRSVRPLVVALALALVVTGCAQKRVSEGIYLTRQGAYPEAILSFRAALERDPRSAIAHYNLGFALSGDVRDRAAAGRFAGTRDELLEANKRFAEALSIDPDEFAPKVTTARRFNFSELYNLAIDQSQQGALDDAERVLDLAAVATDDALSAQRARVLGLQIEMSRALASQAADAHAQYMRVLADLERIKTEGPADDALVDQIENTLARARALLKAEDGTR